MCNYLTKSLPGNNIRLHKNATTTPARRAYIQSSPLSVAALAKELSVTEDTIRRWKGRASVEDGSHTAHRLQTTLTPAQEAVVIALRVSVQTPPPLERVYRHDSMCYHQTPPDSAGGSERLPLRQITRLPLDDLLVVTREFIHGRLTRSALHRLLKPHGLSRLPAEGEETKAQHKTRFKHGRAARSIIRNLSDSSCSIFFLEIS
jgi:hypothetical protein